MKILRALLIAAILPVSAQATTYYVANAGNDTLAGTSPATAWQTVGRVNTLIAAGGGVNPGDQILFNRGDVWRDDYIKCQSLVTATSSTTLANAPPSCSGSGTTIFQGGVFVGFVSTALTTGGPITAIPTVALTYPITAGTVTLNGSNGATQTFTASSALIGATSITVASQTPSSAFPAYLPIKFGAYGAGFRPIIDGADILTGTWTNVSGNVWQLTGQTQVPYGITVDGQNGPTLGLFPVPNYAGIYCAATQYNYLDSVMPGTCPLDSNVTTGLGPYINGLAGGSLGTTISGSSYGTWNSAGNSAAGDSSYTFDFVSSGLQNVANIGSNSWQVYSLATGSGYSSSSYAFTATCGGSADTMTGTMQASGGVIQGVTITNKSSCAINPAVVITSPGAGTGATFAYTKDNGSFYWSASTNTITVQLADGSNPNSHVMEAAHRRYGILMQSSNFTDVTGIAFAHQVNSGIALQVYSTDTLGGNYFTNEYHNITNNAVWNSSGSIIADSNLLNQGGKSFLQNANIGIQASNTGTNPHALRGLYVANNLFYGADGYPGQRGSQYNNGGYAAGIDSNQQSVTISVGANVVSAVAQSLSLTTPVTSLALVLPLVTAIPSGSVTLTYPGGATQAFTTTGAAIGATTLPVASQTPTTAYSVSMLYGSDVFAFNAVQNPAGPCLSFYPQSNTHNKGGGITSNKISNCNGGGIFFTADGGQIKQNYIHDLLAESNQLGGSMISTVAAPFREISNLIVNEGKSPSTVGFNESDCNGMDSPLTGPAYMMEYANNTYINANSSVVTYESPGCYGAYFHDNAINMYQYAYQPGQPARQSLVNPSTFTYYTTQQHSDIASGIASGATVTSIPTAPLTYQLVPGDVVIRSSANTANLQHFTTTGAAIGATSIPVTSATAAFTFVSTAIQVAGSTIGWLDGNLSTASAITSLKSTPTSTSIGSGVSVTLTDGTNTQTFTTSATVASGATTIAVTSQTPNFAYDKTSVITTGLSNSLWANNRWVNGTSSTPFARPYSGQTGQCNATMLNTMGATTDICYTTGLSLASTTPATSKLGFRNEVAQDYSLGPSSLLRSAGTGGQDIGAMPYGCTDVTTCGQVLPVGYGLTVSATLGGNISVH